LTISDPTLLPVHVLSSAIAQRRLSPVELVDALLDKIASKDPKLHAFVEVYAEDARLAAEAADKALRSGHGIGPLHGIPIAVKDLFELEGRTVTGGSMIWSNRKAARTATVVRKLLAHGLIVLGKTHTVEFALGGWGTNQHLGTPWNPWDPMVHRTPGGSSSGSGVAVAARLAPWALGTDTGGSVRLPAAWCGVTGLKTTRGRISIHGILPLSPTLDTPGPIARTVEDAALLYTIMQGTDPLDPLTRGVPVSDPIPTLKHGIAGLRLGRMPDAERSGIEPEILGAYDSALDVLAALGAQIVDTQLPMRLTDYAGLSAIMMAEAYALHAEFADNPDLPLDEAVRARLRSGAISARDYLLAVRDRGDLQRAFADALASVDALLTPTTQSGPIPLDHVDHGQTPAVLTRFVNLLGLCALALPNGYTRDGLPSSLQIVCREFDEVTALRVGWAYQNATEWHERMPPTTGDPGGIGIPSKGELA
jgi:aspartyl-tRNA(Asn)/glutamyl-tRNA(Gln) amidotransferase subunit A